MAKDDLYFMKKALAQAKRAAKKNEVPVGAVLVKNGKIVAKGHNIPIRSLDPTAHAEIVCLRAGARKLKNYRVLDTELYVSLEPCIMCYSALVHGRVKRLVYGASDPKNGIFSTQAFTLIKHTFNHKIEVLSGVRQDESSRLLKDFFNKRRGAGAVERDGLENR